MRQIASECAVRVETVQLKENHEVGRTLRLERIELQNYRQVGSWLNESCVESSEELIQWMEILRIEKLQFEIEQKYLGMRQIAWKYAVRFETVQLKEKHDVGITVRLERVELQNYGQAGRLVRMK